jgi:hypothetical protein
VTARQLPSPNSDPPKLFCPDHPSLSPPLSPSLSPSPVPCPSSSPSVRLDSGVPLPRGHQLGGSEGQWCHVCDVGCGFGNHLQHLHLLCPTGTLCTCVRVPLRTLDRPPTWHVDVGVQLQGHGGHNVHGPHVCRQLAGHGSRGPVSQRLPLCPPLPGRDSPGTQGVVRGVIVTGRFGVGYRVCCIPTPHPPCLGLLLSAGAGTVSRAS